MKTSMCQLNVSCNPSLICVKIAGDALLKLTVNLSHFRKSCGKIFKNDFLFVSVLSTPEPVVESNGKEFRNDPVFYGPDGQILSDEESAFLWNVTNYPADGYDDDEE